LNLEDKVVSILEKTPCDQFSLYRQLGNVKLSEITKTIAELQGRSIIHVVKHRKNYRTGLSLPIYSTHIKKAKKDILDVHSLLAGVTSERLVEYAFVSSNLMSTRRKHAKILDIGCGDYSLTNAISEFGKNYAWQISGIDIALSQEQNSVIFTSLARMDARIMGFRDEVFDQIICISTLEHIGIPLHAYNINKSDELGDIRTILEISRVLKFGGTVILTLPYSFGNIRGRENRVYHKSTLSKLVRAFSIIKKEFYYYDLGKWIKCKDQVESDKLLNMDEIPPRLHSPVCVCLLLRKE